MNVIELKVARVRQRMTIKDLSKVAGVSESTISNVESGKQNPKVETLVRLARALNVSMEVLFSVEKGE